MPNSNAARLLQSLFLITLLVATSTTVRAGDIAPPLPGTVRVVLNPGPAGADAYVESTYPTMNYGAHQFLTIGLPHLASFCAFDLTGVVPADSTVVTAQIVLWGGWMNGQLMLSPAAAAWDEMTVTWNNQPAGIPALQVAYPISRDAPGGPCYSGCVSAFDVTNIVQQWTAGVIPNHGFRLTADTPGYGWMVASFESTTEPRPVLVIDYASTTPTTPRSWGSVKTLYR